MMLMSNSDVIIIGGGILGAALAFELTKESVGVQLIDRSSISREGSGATAGNLHIQAVHTRRPGQVIALDNVRLLPLQIAASRLWDDVEDELPEDIELRRTGGLTVAESESQGEEILLKRGHEIDAGIPGEILGSDEARRLLPDLGDSVRLAEFCPLDGYVNPLKVTPAWMRAALRQGLILRTHDEVLSISKVESSWIVKTKNGQFACSTLVIVAGPWIDRILSMIGVSIHMNPVAIQMHLTERIAPRLPFLVQHIAEGMSIKQVSAGQVMIGGGWPAQNLALGKTSDISLESMTGNLSQAVRILPFLKNVRLLRSWTGALGATADEMPIIGEVPGHDGLFVAGGTYAFTFAPLWAKTLLDLILKRAPKINVSDLGIGRLMNVNKSKTARG
jgi:sarcosine oxidase subunit beta